MIIFRQKPFYDGATFFYAEDFHGTEQLKDFAACRGKGSLPAGNRQGFDRMFEGFACTSLQDNIDQHSHKDDVIQSFHPMLTAATVDRMTHKSYIIDTNGSSYRLRQRLALTNAVGGPLIGQGESRRELMRANTTNADHKNKRDGRLCENAYFSSLHYS